MRWRKGREKKSIEGIILEILTCKERQEVAKSVNETASEAGEEGNSRVPDAGTKATRIVYLYCC